jgi:hypothetical protein
MRIAKKKKAADGRDSNRAPPKLVTSITAEVKYLVIVAK